MGDVNIRYNLDAREFEAAIKEIHASLAKAEQAAKEAGDAIAKGATQGEKATVDLSDAERRLAAEMKAAEKALQAKAEALGLTTAQARKLGRTLEEQAKAEAKVADAAAKAAAAITAQEQAIAELSPELVKMARARSADIAAEKEQAKALGLTISQMRKLKAAQDELNGRSQTLRASTDSVSDALLRSRRQLEGTVAVKGIATKRANSFREQLDRVADSTGELDSTLKGLGGAIGVSNKEMDRTLAITGELFGGVEALARILRLLGSGVAGTAGTIAGLVGAAAAAAAGLVTFAGEATATGPSMATLEKHVKSATDAVRQATSDILDLRDELRGLRTDQDDVALSLAVANGALSDQEAQVIRTTQTLRAEYQKQIDAQAKLVEARKAERKANEEQIKSGRLSFDEQQKLRRANEDLTRTIEAETKNLVDLRREQEGAAEKANELADAQRRAAERAEVQREAEQRVKKALQDSQQAAKDYAKRLSDLNKEAERAIESGTYLDLAELYRRIREEIERSPAAAEKLAGALTGLAAAIARTDEELEFEAMTAEVDRTASSVYRLAEAADAIAPPDTLERVDQLRLLMMQMEGEALRSSESADALADSMVRVSEALEKAELAQKLQTLRTGLELGADGFGALSSAAGLAAQIVAGSMGESAKAAIRLAKLTKALSLVEAIAQGALAVQKALASAPPPVNFIQAGLVGAAAAVQVATIATQEIPSYYQGTAAVPAPDAIPSTLHSGEAVLTKGAVARLGEDEVNRLNRRTPPAEQGRNGSVDAWKHRLQGAMLRDAKRVDGQYRGDTKGSSSPGRRSR